MSRFAKVVFLTAAVCAQAAHAQVTLTDDGIRSAIAQGSKYKSRQDYLDHGMSIGKVKFASAFALDGMSKYVTFFSDYDIVAAAAADAHREMRSFTVEDARKLPLEGLIFGLVQITARGGHALNNIGPRYATNETRVVLQMGDSVVQPLRKEAPTAKGPSVQGLPVVVSTWYSQENLSVLTAEPLGFQPSKVEQEFAFRLTPDDLKHSLKAYLIDATGGRIEKDVDLQGLVR